jgi:S-adenosylmethionine-dependent methyltransferase
MNNVESFYDKNAQIEWERFDRHPMEFALTRRALAEYLPPAPAKILDCGGGPGRYAIHLTRLGNDVTLLDLSLGNLNLAQARAKEAGVTLSNVVHGNALDLSPYDDGSFDAVLLLGPLYHLLTDEDRVQAVTEAMRVLRPGGPLFAGFITFYAPFRDSIAKGNMQDFVNNPSLAENLLASQTIPNNTGFTDAWFAYPTDVIPLMEGCGLSTLALMAVEGLTSGQDKNVKALDAPAFAYWADLNYRFCTDPHLWGAADHLLYVGLK